MKAAIFEAFGGPIDIREVPDPAVEPDGAVIRVEATGICRSDWHGWMGHDSDVRLPHVPGHELAGVVEAAGPGVTRWKPGDRVTVPFCCGCGRCEQCEAGFQNVCDDYSQPGFTHWGSFAERVAIRHADVNLVRLPEGIDFVSAASLGCRFITSFRAVVDQGRASPGEWVAIHGCGGVGLSAIMIADALGARVIGVDIDDDKLALARRVGAGELIRADGAEDVAETIREITKGGAHVSIDALGSETTCRNSIACLRKRGRHVQVGLMVADESAPPIPMGRVLAHELEILGSHGMQAYRYQEVFAMIEAGKLHPKRMLGKTVALEDAPAELAAMAEFRGVGITVIDRF